MTRKTASILGAEHHRYSFDQFVVDIERGALLHDGVDIPLRPKCFEVLTYLVKHHGVLVTKDQLMDVVWPNSMVTEDSLTQCLLKIRVALGDTKKEMIRTIPRRGFIFDVPVRVLSPGEVSEPATAARPWLDSRKPSGWSIAVAAVLTLAIAITWWNPHTKTPDQSAFSAPALPTSIAVLPFTDMSPEGDQEYFADGLSEEVLNLLAQIPELQVIARTSSFSFKGQRPDITTIAAQLNVANILEGSVRKDGNRIRVTAQLVSAADSAHLWSKTYDRNLDNPFAVQSEIAESVAGFLKGGLLNESGGFAASGHNPAAYDHYLKGKFFFSRRGNGDNERAMAQYQQALDIDPVLAEAWVGMAGSIRLQGSNREIPWQEALDKIKPMLYKAIELDPDNAEVHIRLFNYYYAMGMENKSRQHLERALELGQSNALVLSIAAGNAIRNKETDKAIELQRRAAILDPLGFVNSSNLGRYLFIGGFYSEAREQLLDAAALSPEHAEEVNWTIGLTLIMEKQYSAAEPLMQQVVAGDQRDQGMALIHFARGEQHEFKAAIERLAAGTDFDSAFYLAEIFSFQGDLDQSFLWLQEATDRVLQADPQVRNIFVLKKLIICPFLAPLRDDPRWSVWLTSTEKRVDQIRS
jgi:TolB-like protein/DNA-binding winged helix-turn-helix (wHTH) protein/tetratricopeptide (TPR) repeat protein